MRGFSYGDGRNKQWLYLGTWSCKFDGRQFCPCCQPKNAVHIAVPRHPMWREYFMPNETGKSKVPKRR